MCLCVWWGGDLSAAGETMSSFQVDPQPIMTRPLDQLEGAGMWKITGSVHSGCECVSALTQSVPPTPTHPDTRRFTQPPRCGKFLFSREHEEHFLMFLSIKRRKAFRTAAPPAAAEYRQADRDPAPTTSGKAHKISWLLRACFGHIDTVLT